MVTIMVVTRELQRAVEHLLRDQAVVFAWNGSHIAARIFDSAFKISLSTAVYNGDNYIPQSVRNSLKEIPPFAKSFVKTSLAMNEQECRISLQYIGKTDILHEGDFYALIEEFSHIAENWRLFLDENGRQDLVYVHAK